MTMEKIVDPLGRKLYQRNDREDRALPFRNWLRTIDGPICMDLDIVTFRVLVDEEVEPTAILEITRNDHDSTPMKYLNSITDRFFNRDWQGKMVRAVAKALEVPAYIVLFDKDVCTFWIFDIQKMAWYDPINRIKMEKFLQQFK